MRAHSPKLFGFKFKKVKNMGNNKHMEMRKQRMQDKKAKKNTEQKGEKNEMVQ